ncbi:major facilitator superfamily domain-containing protein [Limtongia smithiae]|uniref:major facilitator superfamily domain-containing protein n=1 Tax=Limtongia smithiae TaxID=1125753 RepID=UPI0034CD65A9
MGLISWYKRASAPPPKDLTYSEGEIKEKFAEFYRTDYELPTFYRYMSYIWDTYDKPKAYRTYMFKLDNCVMFYFFLVFFMKTLDNTNISNAYVSGMQEDLSLNGQQRNLFTTVYNIGAIVGAIPGQITMHNYIRPAIWLPSMMMLWTIAVMFIAACQSAGPIYALRFLIGVFESSNYPAVAQIIGSWYRPEEVAKRMCVYDIASGVGSMCSGFIQAGLLSSLDGVNGIAGWRWLFIFDGIISLPIGLFGFWCLPDYPETTRAVWLTPTEKEFSVVRMLEMGKKSKTKMTLRKFFGFFKSWRIYGFNWPYVLFNMDSTYTYFNLWLESLTKPNGDSLYSPQQLNLIPTGGYAASLTLTYLMATVSDHVGKRAPFILIAVAFGFVGNLLMQIWYLPTRVLFMAQYFTELGYPVWGLILTWSADAFQDDPELRGILTAVGNTISGAISAWLALLTFPTPKAPHYVWGYGFMAGLNALSAVGVMFFVYMERREIRMKKRVLNKYGLAVDVTDLHDYEIVEDEKNTPESESVDQAESLFDEKAVEKSKTKVVTTAIDSDSV